VDRVTKSLLKSYVENAGLQALTESAQFERFATHVCLAKIHGGTFSADDFCVGDGVQGVDAVAIAVNGSLVSDADDLQASLDHPGPITAELTFLQAKTSAKFELGDLSIFADMVLALLSGTADTDTVGLREFSEMLDLLYEHSDRFTENPVARLYYVTGGNWSDPQPLVNKITATVSAIESTNMVARAEFTCWGASEVQRHWRSIDSGLKTTVLFESKTTLPDMPGVQEAYLGILPANELLKLVADEDGEIRKALFYDNVRDFQGDVDVNEDIRETLRSEERQKFCVLNNGVTLVAKSLKTTANRFTVSDYQVVNGCQTSHVLHLERDHLDGVYVPFRLIVTNDDEVAKDITRATNKQTQVSRENLLALRDEQKGIEQYFNAFSGEEGRRIYYERRSKQWMGSEQIRGAWKVITLRNLMQSFASMYLKIPHTAARYYRDLRDRAEADVFRADHHPAYFYSAAYAYCKLDHFFRSGQIDRKYKPARYHLLAGVRVWFTGSKAVDSIESREGKAERSLAAFNQFLWNDAKYLEALLAVATVISEESGGVEITRDFGRNREQTDSLLDKVLAARP
jgi:hypothetical protein